MRTDREIKLETLVARTVKDAATASESLARVTASSLLLIPFMHNAILQGTGDMGETNRADLSKKLDPELIKVVSYVNQMQALQGIYKEDPVEYQNALDTYLAEHPDALVEVETILG